GGANWLESSRLDTYHGDRLVERGDVVFVSLNYRLGVFGWLDVSVLGGDEYKGSHSNGLRDQALALRWIKDNIAAFGGDADNITVMGESAGSIDLSWLLTNGHLDGIAKRVVLMSGIAGLIGLSGDLKHGFTADYAQQDARKFIDMCGFESMDQLMAMDTAAVMERVTKVVRSVDTLFVMDSVFWPRHLPDFAPVDPFRAAAKGGSRGIDVMVGYTTYEMGLWLTWDETLDKHPARWSAEHMPYLNEAQRDDIVKVYNDTFPQDPEGMRGMHMIGDSIFVIPSLWFADTLARRGDKVWMFQFDWETDDRRRALHAGDQTFLFGSLHTHAGHHLCGEAKDEADAQARQKLSHAMQDAIIAYARAGDPNAHKNADLPAWPRYDADQRAIMSFDLENVVVNDPAKARREWWYENIYGPALKD
ncbi:MAG: carboxylesterase family protein, partial [Alphaproteobacteria bacterium]|nr:carboxylesterase family protein [Alphaproteobacteria bacterium]